jgi:uncharacterized protein (DUF488 family)
MIKIYTIGFAGKTEEQFYQILHAAGVRCIWDVRLWRDSVADYFTWARGSTIARHCKHKYEWHKELAPTDELLGGVKHGGLALVTAFDGIRELLAARAPEKNLTPTQLDGVCLMCSEKLADNCHRKIVAEYLAAHFANIEIVHL